MQEKKKDKKKDLRDYRIIQAALAVYRDDGYCVRCYWNGKLRPYEHVHHVFGRGTEVDSVNEQYDTLLCLCIECHGDFNPVRVPTKEIALEQLMLLNKANEVPVNSRFCDPQLVGEKIDD